MNENKELTLKALLHAEGIQRVDLHGAIGNIRKGGEVTEDRCDVNAIVAIFIEEAWQEVGEWIKEHHAGLPVKKYAERGVSYKTVQPGELLNHKFSDDIINDMMVELRRFLEHKIIEWYEGREKRRINLPESRTAEEMQKDEWYEKYREFTSNNRQVASGGVNPLEHMSGGINTSIDIILKIFKVIPHVYRSQYHPNTITSAQAEMIAKNSQRTITALAAMNITHFSMLEQYLKKNGHGADFRYQDFSIAEEKKDDETNLSIKINPTILNDIKNMAAARRKTTGCPALAVKGPNGKNVVAEFYEWMMAIAKDQYFPFFDKLNERIANQNPKYKT